MINSRDLGVASAQFESVFSCCRPNAVSWWSSGVVVGRVAMMADGSWQVGSQSQDAPWASTRSLALSRFVLVLSQVYPCTSSRVPLLRSSFPLRVTLQVSQCALRQVKVHHGSPITKYTQRLMWTAGVGRKVRQRLVPWWPGPGEFVPPGTTRLMPLHMVHVRCQGTQS